ncbi:MAG: type toxin-antitoxin system PemK/MazF family toxin [Nocardioidaceae bacterium]|nr:type toxin-antitoxin system PemK/MazF family toxin [Nocardioidaceae bacterium]
MRLPRLRAVLPTLPRLPLRRTTPVVSYEPVLDGKPDPGEVVWAWVPFQEDPTQGKDRPVLVIGRDGADLLTLPLTSKDHDRDEAQEESQGRYWMDVGRGTWDRQRRPSEVRLDRLVRLRPADVRREGAILPWSVFDLVVVAAREHHAI